MNVKDGFFYYFQENPDEDEEQQQQQQQQQLNSTVPDLCVRSGREQIDDMTLHSPPPVEQRPTLVETETTNGFKPWKWKSPLSPIPNAKRKFAGDPQRPGGYKRKVTKSNYHESPTVRNKIQDILANLKPQYPFFLTSMIHSNVVHGFSLTLPKKFCYWHLPFEDATIILEDERGDEFRTNFLWDKGRLSGGWRGFCIAEKLVIGDLLVFHLVSPLKFKVYKVEPHSLTEVDAAFILLKLSLSTLFEEYHPMHLSSNVCQGDIPKTTDIRCYS